MLNNIWQVPFLVILALNMRAHGASWSVPATIEEPKHYTSYRSCEDNLIPQAVLEAARRAGQFRKAFWNTLSYFIGRTQFRPPENRTIQVLHLGCGRANEADIIATFFTNGRFGAYPGENIKVLGIDIDAREIEQAIRNNERLDMSSAITTYFLPSIYQFVVGDATQLSSVEGIPGQADVIIMRHEQISADEGNQSGAWHRIIQQALSRLTQEGIIIATSYSDIEANMFLEAAKSMGATVLAHGENPYGIPLSGSKVSADRVVTILKK